MMVWLHARNHPARAGIRGGPNLRVMRRQLRTRAKVHVHQTIAACLAIASGGQWTQARNFEAGICEHVLCARCGLEAATLRHRYWACPNINELNDEAR